MLGIESDGSPGRAVAYSVPAAPDDRLLLVGFLFGSLDLGGLVTPEFTAIRHDDARVLAQLQRLRPDYLVIFPVDRPILRERADLFTPVRDFMIPGGELTTASSNYVVIYRTVWAGG